MIELFKGSYRSQRCRRFTDPMKFLRLTMLPLSTPYEGRIQSLRATAWSVIVDRGDECALGVCWEPHSLGQGKAAHYFPSSLARVSYWGS